MMPAPAACRRDDLRIERNAFGEPVRVFIGPLDVTPLVARVQTNVGGNRLAPTQEQR